MKNDICGNCKFFDKNTRYVNNSYGCRFHNFSTNPEDMGCYMIQYNNILK